MTPNGTEGGPAAPAGTASAGAILRPALTLWLVTQLLYGVLAQLWTFVWEADFGPKVRLAVNEVGWLLAYALVGWYVWPDAEARRVWATTRPRMTELCLVVGVATSLLLAMWEYRIPDGWSTSAGFYLEHEADLPWQLTMLTGALAPALFEEWMFRGLLLDRLGRVLPLGLAVGLQAMLFSVWHFDPVMVLPHFVFGVVCGVLRLAAGALWPCMLMHFLWNAHVILLVYGLV